MQTLWREPEELAAGDTLTFERVIGAYPASAGWQLTYDIIGAGGASQAIQFTSTPDGDSHKLTVASTVTAAWLAGNYTLFGYAALASTGERHQIYQGPFEISPNAETMAGNDPTLQTAAQKMVTMLEGLLNTAATGPSAVLESRIGETLFRYESLEQIRTEHGYWVGRRRNEVAKQRAKEGRPTGNKIRPLVNVVRPGPSAGTWGFGTGYQGW